jgi:hypothetical protein
MIGDIVELDQGFKWGAASWRGLVLNVGLLIP